jgi:hypothetical protein
MRSLPAGRALIQRAVMIPERIAITAPASAKGRPYCSSMNPSPEWTSEFQDFVSDRDRIAAKSRAKAAVRPDAWQPHDYRTAPESGEIRRVRRMRQRPPSMSWPRSAVA